MKKKWLIISLIFHLGTAVILCLKIPKSKDKIIIISKLSEKDLQKLQKQYKEDQIVNNSKANNKKPKTLEKVYLSKENNSTKKNTTVKKNDKFIQGQGEFGSAPKSIAQKGKFKPEGKGKGVSATDDFILGAEIGPMTILNSQEFKYFSYYDRIKEQITETWRPLVRKAIKLVKSNPKKYGALEVRYYTTKLEVKLNSKGELLEIIIAETSGQDPFDQASVQAFKKSAPFSGPPKELIKDGKFTLIWRLTVNVEQESLIGKGGGQI